MTEKILYSLPETKALLEEGSVLLVDIRDQDTFAGGHIPTAVNLPEIFSFLSESSPEGLAETVPVPSYFAPRPDDALMATREDVRMAMADPAIILLDNRDANEWLGHTSSPYGFDFAPRRGRIPGARWIEWYSFMNRAAIPAFRPVHEIRALCASQQIYPDSDIIIFCFKGSRAANTCVALKLAGFTRLRVYFASWNEWARDMSLPIESGEPHASGDARKS